MATQLAERRADPIVVFRQTLDKYDADLRAALPDHISLDKFKRVARTAVNNNPDLLSKGDRASLFGAIVRLAQDGLLPDGREAAIVLFGNKAQAMPMIAGILKKVRQSGDVAKVSAQVVYEHDEFVWRLGFDEDVTHNPPPLDQPRGKAIGAYATAVLKDGSRCLEVMNFDEIEQVRKVSRASGNGPWVQWWGEMARKTVMRRLSKRLPMSTDLEDDFERDETLPPEPVIEHGPQPSRLDMIESQIGADEPEAEEVAEAEVVELPTSAADEPAPKAKTTTRLQQQMGALQAEARGEGKPDADQGETVTLASAKDEIDRCELVGDVNNRAAALAQHLCEAEADELMQHAAAKIDSLTPKQPAA